MWSERRLATSIRTSHLEWSSRLTSPTSGAGRPLRWHSIASSLPGKLSLAFMNVILLLHPTKLTLQSNSRVSMSNPRFASERRPQRENVKTTKNKQAVLKKKERLLKTVDTRRRKNRVIDRKIARGLSPIQEKVDTPPQDQAVEMEGTPGNISETDDPFTAQDPAANHGSPDDEEDAAAQDFEEEDLNPANFAETDNIVDDEDLIHANLAETDDLTAQDESAEENASDGEEDATAAAIIAPEEALRAEALRSAKRCKRDIRWIDYNCVISRRSRRHPNWLRF